MESITFIQWCLDHLNYWTIMFLMTLESTFIPVPSELVVPPAAYHAASNGEMNFWLIILFATVGACLGATINYVLSLYVGKPIIYKFANSRVGHLCLLNEEKLQRAENYFVEHGSVSTFIGRLIPVIRHLISIPAGLSKMHYGKFLAFTALGAGIWNVVLAALGHYLQKVVPEDQLISTVTTYSHEIGYSLLAIVVLFIVYKVIKKKCKK